MQQNELSDNNINAWLSEISKRSAFPVSRIKADHWQLVMRNSIAQYTLDIFDQGQWITYGSTLVPDVVGSERVTFYASLLKLNAQLNGVHIGLDNNRVILSREEPKEGLTPLSFAQSIIIFDNALQFVYVQILEEIHRLGLKFNNAEAHEKK